MKTANDCTRFVEDLAAQWTDPALEMLKATGTQEVSVALELETWQTLQTVLHDELRQQHLVRVGKPISLGPVMERVVRQAIQVVVQKIDRPVPVTHMTHL